ncbi:MAG: ABC transporter permease subunit [Gammaproteobacteria bacterium]|nr:ABC transporter permease subunit [Gammaproteobacteria bacterium]MDH3450075.1 ABC transporter permease subunit [Gammaproteobacteria bacterium]
MEATTQQPLWYRIVYDKETRSVAIQVLTIALLFAFFFYIVRNAIVNLETIGKGYSFSFLWDASNYDINQTLIEYDSRSPHWRAAIVGIINTLLVAVAGIILSTIVGFLLGVLRLSHNWLINRVVYVYIEYVRNVPVLLHILLVHGIIVNTLPVPKNAMMAFDGTLFLTNRGFYTPKPIFEPAMWAVLIAFIIGIAFAIWFRGYAKKIQDATGKIYPVLLISLGAIILFPIIVFFLAGMPINLDYPELAGFNFKGGLVLRPEFVALWIALSLYTAAFIAEIVRAGIQAISHGQTEAAFALGITPGRTMQLVIIPQALRVIIPPLSSQYLNITKNSSLAIAIGYMDIVATIGGISLNQTGREMECMTIVLALYLSFSLLISAFMNWYNKRIKLVER